MSDPRSGDSAISLDTLREALRRFAAERDWDQFHSPKNLSMALSVESAELMEHFQWLTVAESEQLSCEKRKQIQLEMADVLLFLIRLADKLDIDLLASAQKKLAINALKYPVHKARGTSKKYSEL
jgi:NTP pyrophosphatase (non-canonical NTP hydrolase)